MLAACPASTRSSEDLAETSSTALGSRGTRSPGDRAGLPGRWLPRRPGCTTLDEAEEALSARIKVTTTVHAHGDLGEKAAALTQLGNALSAGLSSPVVVDGAPPPGEEM
jgi:hypothetical protein